MRRRSVVVPTVVVTLALGLGACTAAEPRPAPQPSAPAPSASPPSDPSVDASEAPSPEPQQPQDLLTDLVTPWGISQRGDTLVVTERDSGRILSVEDGAVTELATVDEITTTTSEGGLLGVELSPEADALFVYYTTSQDNRVARYPFADGEITGQPEVILDGIPAASFHNGGQLRFGPDRFLYVATGDAGITGLAQDTESLGGKVLRITAEGDPAPDNPFDNEVWSWGHRNVQGLAFDPEGRLFASEFGQNSFDEVNLITRGGNYGWPEVEGDGTGPDGDYIAPLLTWTPDEASPSGLAWAQGSLWMAGLRGERLWQIPLEADEVDGEPIEHLHNEFGRLRAVLATDDGLLLGTSNTDGRGAPRPDDDRIMTVEL